MSDLVERLRFDVGSRPGGICEEAADEIERLQAAYAESCVQMHGLLMEFGLKDCGFGTPKDWRVKASAEVERLRAELAESVRLHCWKELHDAEAERDALRAARHEELSYVIEQAKVEYDLNGEIDNVHTRGKLMNLRMWAMSRRDRADVVKERAALDK